MDILNISNFRLADLPSENEIIASWPSLQPFVSVICTTFNHEQYIEDAIRGFLIQRTNFPFEIVIHDDASSDGTQDIVGRYAKAYPRLIKPVFQKVNQYSQGKKPIPLAAGHAQGDYIALCEGDDFWLSEEKLQRQMDAIRMHPECELCFHPAKVLHQNGNMSKMANYFDKITIIPVETLISADGSFCPTASLLFRRSVFDRLPAWFYDKAPVGDYYFQVLGSLSGGALFLPGEMAVYRSLASGSWSSSLHKKGRDGIISHFERTIYCLSKLDEFTEFKYSVSINRAKSIQAFSTSILFLRKKNINEFISYMKLSWSYCRSLFINQFFVLSRKILLRAFRGF